eukprot:COSAG01_NODE_814_length_13398_cov_4.254230_3_plen_311_part_00
MHAGSLIKIKKNMQNNIIITGASGFIGQHLQSYIKAHSVYKSVPWSRSSKQSKAEKHFAEAGACIHLAAKVHDMRARTENDDATYYKSNVVYALKMAKLAIQHDLSCFVFISSVKVYGEAEGCYTEQSALSPQGAYARSKVQAEEALDRLFKDQACKTRLIILRLPMVYGKNNKGNMQRLLKVAKHNWPLPLGRATQERSILYVKNLCSALLHCIENPSITGIFNISDPAPISPKALYEHCVEIYVGRKARFFTLPNWLLDYAASYFAAIKKYQQRLFSAYIMPCEKFQKMTRWQAPFHCKSAIKDAWGS